MLQALTNVPIWQTILLDWGALTTNNDARTVLAPRRAETSTMLALITSPIDARTENVFHTQLNVLPTQQKAVFLVRSGVLMDHADKAATVLLLLSAEGNKRAQMVLAVRVVRASVRQGVQMAVFGAKMGHVRPMQDLVQTQGSNSNTQQLTHVLLGDLSVVLVVSARSRQASALFSHKTKSARIVVILFFALMELAKRLMPNVLSSSLVSLVTNAATTRFVCLKRLLVPLGSSAGTTR